MSKVSYRSFSAQDHKKLLQKLAKVIATLKSTSDISVFLEYLLTPSEIIMVTRRLQIAQRLAHNIPVRVIRRELGVGISTIYSVKAWLKGIVNDRKSLQQYTHQSLRKSKTQGKPQRPRKISSIPIRYSPEYWLIDLLFGGMK